VTEGEDKPLKYPSIFFKSELMVLNKVDLLPYVPFSVEQAMENANRSHPGIQVILTSCVTATGLNEWMAWLAQRLSSVREAEAVQV